MFHIFTLQGKRIDSQLEHIPQNIKVDRIAKKERPRKTLDREPSGPGPGAGSGEGYAREAYRKAAEPEQAPVPVLHAGAIMSSPVITISPDLTASEAWEKFREAKVRHMPVISADGSMIGIVSDRDLLKRLIINEGRIEDARSVTVKEIMAVEVIAAPPQTDIRRVARAMLENHVGTMPIVNEAGLPVGIVTRSDILHAIIHHPGFNFWA
ncbi:MAG: CBS domain-containing protein [Spirochaetes bacterium]|nr:CBS domain-containing protein [Spirochaetota bacterium]